MRITAFEIGPGKSSVLRKLINKIGENNLKIVCTDGDFSYDEELGMNADIKHIVNKSEPHLAENYLASLPRKTKCYSKSALMLELSIALFLHSRELFC